RMRPGELPTWLVAETLRLQPVRYPVVRRRGPNAPPCRQQNRRRRAHRPLMCEQNSIRTPAVAQMLMDVDDGLDRAGDVLVSEDAGGQRQPRGSDKVAPGHH